MVGKQVAGAGGLTGSFLPNIKSDKVALESSERVKHSEGGYVLLIWEICNIC